MSDSSDDGDLPRWLSNYKSPTAKRGRAALIEFSSSDEGSPDPSPTANQPVSPVEAAQISQQTSDHHARNEPAANGAAKHAAVKLPAADKAQPRQPKQTTLAHLVAGRSAATAVRARAGSKSAAETSKPAQNSAGRVRENDGAGPSSANPSVTADDKDALVPQAATDVAAANSADGQRAAKAVHQPVVVPVPGEVPVFIPEKLIPSRMIAELEALEGGATDLAGDSGAVGRILVHESDGRQQVQFDLKGVVYDAKHAPLASTLCIVNIGQTEAKVESVLHSYLQLCRAHPDDDNDDEAHKIFMDEDDDIFQFSSAVGKADGNEDAKPSSKKKAKSNASAKVGVRPAGGVRGGSVKKKVSKAKAKKPGGAKRPAKSKAKTKAK